MISSILFSIFLLSALVLFTFNVNTIRKNIKLGKPVSIKDNKSQRWKNMFMVAIGQSKMTKRPIAGILHIIVYLGFIVVNIEMIEIVYDGISGGHRAFYSIPYYQVLISVLELLAILVIIACLFFLIRRNVMKVKRFHNTEMKKWPRLDANIILVAEIVLMLAFLTMNSADFLLQGIGNKVYAPTGSFWFSSHLAGALSGLSEQSLVLTERIAWWLHIVGVLAFLNYIPFSKHFHIVLAFFNVYYSKLKPLTYLSNMDSVTTEVKIAMGQLTEDTSQANETETFGAKDVKDLSWKSLMDAYSCTECGRCTAVCPANLTGKKLSPRKVVMDTRDRLEEYSKALKNNGETDNSKSLLNNYITKEEIWACTTCSACAHECPVMIDPLSIIIELRRYQFMEESSAPSALNAMCANIENNGAPWQYSLADRANWANNEI